MNISWTKSPGVMTGVVTSAPQTTIKGATFTVAPTKAMIFFDDITGRIWAIHMWGTDTFGKRVGWEYRYINGAWTDGMPPEFIPYVDQGVSIYRSP